MSGTAGLPAALCRLFDGTLAAAHAAQAFSLLALDATGLPHTALLGLGELWAPGDSRLRLALWPASRTVAYLRHAPRAVLTGVAEAAFFQIVLDPVRPLGLAAGLQCFEAHVQRVEMQAVSYARMKNGIAFELESDAEKARWHLQIAALRALR